MRIIRKKLGIAGDLFEVEMPDNDRLELIALLDLAIDEASHLAAGLTAPISKWRQMRKDLEFRS
jgi:hypothetical protein